MNTKFLTIFVLIAAFIAAVAYFGRVFEGLTSNSNSDQIVFGSSAPPASGTYNHFTKETGEPVTGTFTNPTEGSIDVISENTLQLNLPNGETIMLNKKEDTNKEGFTSSAYGTFVIYKADNGSSATVVSGSNGQVVIRLQKPNGQVVYYTKNAGSSSSSSGSSSSSSGSSSSASGSSSSASGSSSSASGSSIYSVDTTPGGRPSTSYTSYSNYPASSTLNTYSPPADYTSALPAGIPRSQIPAGQEDLYILKSEVVPPVCPKCPSFFGMGGDKYKDPKKCPPCPSCSRCPEPAFECKKVPNYNAVNNMTLPVPVLSDFSTFGM